MPQLSPPREQEPPYVLDPRYSRTDFPWSARLAEENARGEPLALLDDRGLLADMARLKQRALDPASSKMVPPPQPAAPPSAKVAASRPERPRTAPPGGRKDAPSSVTGDLATRVARLQQQALRDELVGPRATREHAQRGLGAYMRAVTVQQHQPAKRMVAFAGLEDVSDGVHKAKDEGA